MLNNWKKCLRGKCCGRNSLFIQIPVVFMELYNRPGLKRGAGVAVQEFLQIAKISAVPVKYLADRGFAGSDGIVAGIIDELFGPAFE